VTFDLEPKTERQEAMQTVAGRIIWFITGPETQKRVVEAVVA
jgi:hypothetical protein